MTRSKELAWARPDAKAQVTLAYDENGKIDHVDTIVLSCTTQSWCNSRANKSWC